MNEEHRLPDDDRDLRLARQIGERLDPDDERISAPLLRILDAYRREHPPERPPAEASSRMWAQIERRVVTGRFASLRSVVIRPLRSLPGRAYAAAAVIAVAALAWILLLRPPEPVLLARAEDKSVVYTSSDGSSVTLRPRSTIYEVATSDARMRYRLDGEAFFDVAENPDRAFEVEANDGLVTVLGTEFNVSTWGGRTAVYLTEGRIRFALLSGDDAVTLAPGERSVITVEGVLVAPEPAPPEEHLDWLRGELVFVQQPLHRIVEELQHHFDVSVYIPDTLRQETLTGTLPLNSAQMAFDDLGTVLGGRFDRQEDVYEFVPRE